MNGHRVIPINCTVSDDLMKDDGQKSPAYYRAKAEIMRQQAERTPAEHLRALYQKIAESWEAAAESTIVSEHGN
jgi:hypothetical protein